MLVLIGIAVALALVIAAFVFMGGTKRSKRYRPGSAVHVHAGLVPVRAGAAVARRLLGELPARAVAGRVARPRETGGASDRW